MEMESLSLDELEQIIRECGNHPLNQEAAPGLTYHDIVCLAQQHKDARQRGAWTEAGELDEP